MGKNLNDLESALLNKNILLISPTFFNYEVEIISMIKNLGGHVDFYNERPDSKFSSKVLIRIGLKKILINRIKNYYNNIINETINKKYDYILIISPETITYKILKILKNEHPESLYILYMWDSLQNKKAFPLITLFDRLITFDYNDFLKFANFNFLPLYYIPTYKKTQNKKKTIDLSLIATSHSDRYTIHKKIQKFSTINNLKYYHYLFLSSKYLYFLNRITKISFWNAPMKNFHFNPLSQSDISDIFSRSKVIIDINHPNQNGLTNRSLETLGSSTKMITTNENIKLYNFYNPNNILVIDRKNPIIDTKFVNSKYENIDSEICEKYSLKQFIINIFRDEMVKPEYYFK